ncbi:putative multidrug resistance ABC transporter ATP-binding/permease protein YheH [mine drainage metagenome]|uniref:Putative multidrug resistance ABC transporter ATP-binding/permease protein YheH n=1 Tax=mine drainage metagenome TaxID=410659 RepID=A0A1J5SDE3_9ZZZZ
MKDPRSLRNFMIIHRPAVDEDEEDAMRPLDWGLIRRMFTYAADVRTRVRALLVLTLIRSIQLPALTWVVSLVIVGPIAHRHAAGIAAGVVGYAVLALFTDGLFHFRQRYALEIGETVVQNLRQAIFDHVQAMPMGFFNRVKLGRILGRVTSDVEALRIGIQDVFFVTAVQGGQMLFAAGIMAYCDVPLFLVVLAMAPLLWLMNRRFHGRLSHRSRATQASFSRITATIAESVNGIRVTQGFVREETNAGLFRSLLADHSRYSVALARTSAILQPLLELNSQFFVAVLLVFGGWRVSHGEMTLASLIEFFFLANLFFSPINVIGNQYNQALVAMAGAERVFRLLDTEPDWEEAPGIPDLPDPRPVRAGVEVEFRDVGFAYEAGRPVLSGVSFRAGAGQTVALVGHTGSGKSTVVGLVSKFYIPTAGSVLVDGMDLRSVSSRSLHRQMGMVPQQNFLFTGTVLDNIRLARPGATEAEVRDVVARLGCLDMVEALPRGLHTSLGERGAGLSQGQRQLVCFARAMIADPRLLILDEATSSIDGLTEARLQTALAELLKGRTSFVVAHRLSTIRGADLVLVMDGGRILESGTHQSLLSLNGHYARLHRQFARADAGP